MKFYLLLAILVVILINESGFCAGAEVPNQVETSGCPPDLECTGIYPNCFLDDPQYGLGPCYEYANEGYTLTCYPIDECLYAFCCRPQ